MRYEAIAIGLSSGGLSALRILLPAFPAAYPLPLIIVQHVGAGSGSYWIDMLDKECSLKVKEADEKEAIQPGYAYIAPPNYHLMVDMDRTFALSGDVRVNFARPSIDVLFESAALVYREKLVGVMLTGSNHDGAAGLKTIKQLGGLTLIQDPATADSPSMPQAALEATGNTESYTLENISKLLTDIGTI